jgi:hypothetical protein
MSTFADDLIASLEEALRHARGEPTNVRLHRFETPDGVGAPPKSPVSQRPSIETARPQPRKAQLKKNAIPNTP